MLCQSTIKNFKSIRDEVTFYMQAAAISEHEDRVIKDSDGEIYLPVTVIYGPNGGGKSNVLEALHLLAAKILQPVYAAEGKEERRFLSKRLIMEPFAFSEESKGSPTEFEIVFRTKLAEYRYILHVRKEVIVYESLDRIKLDTGRRSAFFERDDRGIVWKGAFAKRKVSGELSVTCTLLSYLGITSRENAVVKDILSWFENGIIFISQGISLRELRTAVSGTDDVKRCMLHMLQEMDLDIVDFRIEEKEKGTVEVYTKHSVNGCEAELNLSDESGGTKKLFGLLPFIAGSLLTGAVLVIDDLDARIHPVLLRYIIMLFQDMRINRHKAQLIFTAHDLAVMNSEMFRRDEIRFVAKGNAQNSILYSLAEIKNEKGESVRKDAKYDKQYLEGKYGAEPCLKNFPII